MTVNWSWADRSANGTAWAVVPMQQPGTNTPAISAVTDLSPTNVCDPAALGHRPRKQVNAVGHRDRG